MAKSLYVGNLPYSTNETGLTELFAPYGGENARIVEGRGFGFIDVADDQMDAAIEATNGQTFGGRTLTVNEARPREPRASGGGGGGGGRFGGGGGGGGGRGGYGDRGGRGRDDRGGRGGRW
ncbi:MAG: RNA-binding protein [Armatimonadetes bacterium]|nr:RNA-binding protein [Armatimonadota bacterium]